MALFFNIDEIFYQDLVPQGQTEKQHFCTDVRTSIDMHTEDWYVPHHNICAHYTLSVQVFLAKNHITIVHMH
jgi:hypothetical protein